MIKLIIFDWDDVFTLGSTEGYMKCYHQALQDVGVALDPVEERERIEVNWGQDHREELKGLLKEKPELVEKACAAYEHHFFGGTFVGSLRPVAGSIELLNKIKASYSLAIVTGAHPKVLKDIVFPKFGFPDVFSQIITTYDLENQGLSKPNPYMINSILGILQLNPDEAVFVGDAENDITMAKNASVTPVAVLTGHLSQEKAQKLGVKYIINDVTKLTDILNQI
jgi:phosphoglycolate phosphatase-like HAD superfamily hydrolase